MTVDFSAVLAAEVHAADLVRAHDRGEEDSRWTVQAIGLYGHLLDLYNQAVASAHASWRRPAGSPGKPDCADLLAALERSTRADPALLVVLDSIANNQKGST